MNDNEPVIDREYMHLVAMRVSKFRKLRLGISTSYPKEKMAYLMQVYPHLVVSFEGVLLVRFPACDV